MKEKSKIQKYLNRELSWIEFNNRVLSEALDKSVPLLERLKFLAIVGSNFDEFFMVRVASLKNMIRNNDTTRDPSGMNPQEQLHNISLEVKKSALLQYNCLMNEIIPELTDNGIELIKPESYTKTQYHFLEAFYTHDIFPLLTPIKVNEELPFPSTGNIRLHIGFKIQKENEAEYNIAILQIPPNISRFIELPSSEGIRTFAFIEDIICVFAKTIFPGYEIKENIIFKVTRDADSGVNEDRDDDFVAAMEEVLVGRQNSLPVRLNVSKDSFFLRNAIKNAIGLTSDDVYELNGPLDTKSFMEIVNLKGYENLRYENWNHFSSINFSEDKDMWDEIQKRDIILHLPYESFDPVVRFIKEAAEDKDVLAIKITLYRTSGNSSIIKALGDAARSGKQVTAFIELKARFDEERNISWATSLEQAGVIVVYGIARLKVHAKTAMVIRRQPDGLKRYVHLSTGNYNDKTAKLYTDISLFTADNEIASDISLFFNCITGYSSIQNFKRIIMAPFELKTTLIKFIEREAARSTHEYPGLILLKMNSLTDTDVINALYDASNQGVHIHLHIRGVCMLIPGVPEMSENITVMSLIDRYLEHSRIFYFANGGSDELWLSSADWMSRNLEKRIELMFPIRETNTKKIILEIIKSYFKDTQKTHVLKSNGRYVKKHVESTESEFRVQSYFYEQMKAINSTKDHTPKDELLIRKKITGEKPTHG